MSFVVAMITTIVLAFGVGFLLPWWGVAVVAALVGYAIRQRPMMSASSGSLGVFLLWSGHAAWIDHANQGLLSHRVAMLLPLQGNTVLLILITGIVGGIVAGMSAWSGALLRRMTSRSASNT